MSKIFSMPLRALCHYKSWEPPETDQGISLKIANTKNHSKRDGHLRICPRNYFSLFTWLWSFVVTYWWISCFHVSVWENEWNEMQCFSPGKKRGHLAVELRMSSKIWMQNSYVEELYTEMQVSTHIVGICIGKTCLYTCCAATVCLFCTLMYKK